jgi:DNA-binding CsgD family transcriptional regulator
MESLTKTPPDVAGRPQYESDDTTITRRAVYEAFDSAPIGMIITDENARILHLNRTAEELAQQGRGLVIHNRALSAHTRSDAARLRQTISDVVAKARHGRGTEARAMSLYRSSYVHPLSIVVKPMWCTNGGYPRKRIGPLANLIVADPDRRMEAPADLLRPFFDLTPAESVVLEQLVHGLTLQEIADASGTSRNTVRNQLHIVFEKTGTNRQSELIKLVLSTAVWAYGEAQGSAAEC